MASDALKLSAIDGRIRRTNTCCDSRRTHESSQKTRLLAGGTSYGAATDEFSASYYRNASAAGSVSGMAAALSLLRNTKWGGCQCWSYGQDKSAIDFLVSATSLQEVDIPRHVHRIYFAGTNTFGSSWCLPAALPASAMRYVHGRQYRELCAALNADLAWRDWSWERALYLLCWCLCPPAGSYLNRWQRRRRVWSIMTRLLAGDESHRWLRGGVRAEALQDSIRVGISADATLAFIDLLRADDSLKRTRRRPRHAASSRHAASVPVNPPPTPATCNLSLPLALLFAGEGTFECPYYLDPNDVLLRAVPGVAGLSRFIHLDWVDFVAEVGRGSWICGARSPSRPPFPTCSADQRPNALHCVRRSHPDAWATDLIRRGRQRSRAGRRARGLARRCRALLARVSHDGVEAVQPHRPRRKAPYRECRWSRSAFNACA